MTIALRPRLRPAETKSRPANRRTVDQTLSAAAHVAEGFAEYTARIMNGRPGASPPSITEDPVALFRHAQAARRSRRQRDAVCCLVTLLVGGMIVVRLAADLGYRGALPAFGILVAGWAGRRRLGHGLRRWFGWAWRSNRDRRRSRPLRWLVALALFAVVALGLILVQPVVWTCVGLGLLGLGAGWLVIVGESVLAHRRAAEILAEGAPAPRKLATPLRPEMETRLEESANANVIAYGKSRASAPFVGNGFVVRPWKIDVDVHRRKVGEDHDSSAFILFDVVAFHERLEAQFEVENAVESTNSRKLTSGHRLYVDGRKIPWHSDLIGTDRPVPRSRVEWSDLADELINSEQSEDRRVYFYLEEICRGGEIAVSIFVRPLLQGGTLSIEFVPLVVPPIDPDVRSLVDNVPVALRDQIGRAVRLWTRQAPGTVFGSPLRCGGYVREWLSRSGAFVHWRLAARFGWFYDLGAVMSVREGVCWLEPDDFDHFVIQDLIRINDRLRDRLVTSIKAYLREQGIDEKQLDTAVSITNIQNWSVGNVRADMVGFGNDNTFGSPGREPDGGDKG